MSDRGSYVSRASPPLSALIFMICTSGISVYFFPSWSEVDAAPETFVSRVYPKHVSLIALAYIRLMFSTLCFGVTLYAILSKGVDVDPSYLPSSKLYRTKLRLYRLKMLYPFTCWCWNVLGVTFLLLSYIALRTASGKHVSPWILKTTLILWEASAPMTLLVSTVVTYALWPNVVRANGGPGVFATTRSLLQHNANVVMAMTEVAFLGGLPVYWSHVSISVLFGVLYVIFAWVTMYQWHEKGPAFLYFFLDTTLGNFTTIALAALLVVLVIFYSLFSGVDELLHLTGSGFVGRVLFFFVICYYVCKFW